MSNLNHYVRQLRPRTESYTPHVDKVQSILSESSTADATNGEKAICFAYNHFIQGMNEEEALSKAGIETLPPAAKWATLTATGKAVVEDSSFVGRGDFLIHAGTSSAKTYYEKGTDTTSKSDLYISDNPKQNISLKKQGDKGGGAQLMSAMAGEAEGVFKAAIAHYEKSGGVIADTPEFKSAMDILETEMAKTSTNRLNVEVGAGKKDFGVWYAGEFKGKRVTEKPQSTRGQDLLSKYKAGQPANKDKKITDADIVNFLKGELSLAGAAPTKLRKDKEYVKKLPNETPQTKKQIDAQLGLYVKDQDWNVGGAPKSRKDKDKGVKVSAHHFFKGGKTGKSDEYASGVSDDVFESEALKKQIRDVVNVSIKTTEWQKTFSTFFDQNTDLKQWMVYEAASGLYKFTGQASIGQAYPGSQREVANKILVFSDSGFVKEYTNLVEYGANNTQLVDNVVVTYKGDARSKAASVRIFSDYKPEGEMSLLEEILNEETPRLLQEIYQIERSYLLSEGMFSGAINKIKTFVSHVSDLLKNFYEKVIKNFVTKLFELAKQGITKFFEALGLEIEGEVSMKTPSW
jgi:hypothetical protein